MDAGEMQIAVKSPGDAEYAVLDARLVAFNRTQVAWSAEAFTVVLADPGGALRGGARCLLRMGAAELRGLWLDADLRGEGLGVKLVATLEREARDRGARAVLLDTYDFQARGFYEKLGYRCFGTFDYPGGMTRYYMTKALSP